MSYIVQLENGVWLAAWDGDPGRTLRRANARVFQSQLAARSGLGQARSMREFPDAVVTRYKPEPEGGAR